MEDIKKKKITRPAQIILVLRLIAGSYLVYLSWGLIEEVRRYTGARQIVLIVSMVLFFCIGLALAGWSLKKLARGEFLRPWQSEDDFED
ncbi:hypothetical protein [Clostridium sp. AN503]|uniref:hypothetical protein n=1 Tax=Clostridium sp. AN503 TaxID=3160598 RepID=UPI003457DC04